MPMIIECPSCAAKAQVSDNAVGRSVRCPKCQHQYVVSGTPSNGGRIQSAPSQLSPVASLAPSVEVPRPSRGRNVLALLGLVSLPLAGLALVLSGVALGVTLFRPTPPNPLGSGLGKYDFSTPRAALRSQDEIQLNNDIRAELDLHHHLEGPRLRERVNTLEVKKEAEWGGKSILFISYERDGVKKYEIASFEKDTKSGLWKRSYAGSFDVRKSNPELADQMDSWTSKGELTPSRPDGGPGFPKDGKSKEKG